MEDKTIKNEEKTYTDPETGKFVKGNPGGGRPKGSVSIVEALKRKLQEVPEGKEKTYLEYFIEQLMKKTVIEGDVTMMRDIINRIDGMPRQNFGLDGGADGSAILVMAAELIKKNADDTSFSAESNSQ